MTAETPALSDGAVLGVYEIREKIGRGETGDVYRVWDRYREREVALKVLPDDLTRDPACVERFRRTIDILKGLVHPSIAMLYGFEELDGRRVLTMELTAGRLLSDRLAGGAIEPDQAVAIITQVASALEYTHRLRLVHGHLHPADVKIDDSEVVKVYDFGLTRTIETLEAESEIGQRLTVEQPTLRRGGLLRGVAYQSPEQMKGKVDERTDIWAMGVLLWEMLTGANPFLRPTVSETSHAIISEDLDWNALPDSVPPHVRRALQLSLQKRPSIRLRNAGDFILELSTPFDR